MRISVVWSALAPAVVAVVAPLIGSAHIDLARAFARISPDYDILFFARLPRVLLALMAGAALSLTGALFQCMLRDPLAEPYTLGVSAGASVGAVLGDLLRIPIHRIALARRARAVLLVVLGIAVEGRRLSSSPCC